MQKITPHLWFDKEAREAAEFYVSAFGGDSGLTNATIIPDTPSGDVELVVFRLLGYEFMAISAGPLFRINPSISFMVNFDPSRRAEAKPALDTLWGKLADGGTALMPLDKYPTRRPRSTITGRSLPPTRKPSNAAGSRINSASLGRSHRRKWARCWRAHRNSAPA
jgi:predicted 3-demethylubiquinone-9 3-methyltransferase (glyoxalase superfamily)